MDDSDKDTVELDVVSSRALLKALSEARKDEACLADFLVRRVLELEPRKSRLQIANEAGFASPNIITTITQGSGTLPLDRVPSMARALECDPIYLMRLALEQEVGSQTAQAMIEVFGTPVTANELGWLEAIREASGNKDPQITRESRSKIISIFRK